MNEGLSGGRSDSPPLWKISIPIWEAQTRWWFELFFM